MLFSSFLSERRLFEGLVGIIIMEWGLSRRVRTDHAFAWISVRDMFSRARISA